jgi:hypothetical protein
MLMFVHPARYVHYFQVRVVHRELVALYFLGCFEVHREGFAGFHRAVLYVEQQVPSVRSSVLTRLLVTALPFTSPTFTEVKSSFSLISLHVAICFVSGKIV